jgi:hypothetical protein
LYSTQIKHFIYSIKTAYLPTYHRNWRFYGRDFINSLYRIVSASSHPTPGTYLPFNYSRIKQNKNISAGLV